MIERSSTSITPDGLTGMIFCLEGVRGTIVLLNGPMGCKFYHSTTSDFLTVHPPLYLPVNEYGHKVPVDYNFLNDWFFRQSRVPCTYLDGYDYVYGTVDKVREALTFLNDNIQFELLAIVNSPGASLIGDQLQETAADTLPNKHCIILESPGLSEDFAHGYDSAVRELLRQVIPRLHPGLRKKVTQHPSVNILGLSIWNRHSEGDRNEIRRLLGLCGIDVNCFVACDSTLDELSRLQEADLNVVIYPDMAPETLALLERDGMGEAFMCEKAPIGFENTRAFIEGICQRLDTDASAYYDDEERARARAWKKIEGIYQFCGLPTGATFAIEGSKSQVEGYVSFLENYLGMQFLDGDVSHTDAELVFGDANTIGALKAQNKVFCGVEINYPSMGYVDLIPKTHIGVQGALFLIEQVLSGLMSRV